MHTRFTACIVTLGLMASAHAFEPGSDRVCTPSADGETFECLDKSANASAPGPAEPINPASATPAAAASTATIGGVAQPATPAADVPNYLLQRPATPQPAIPAEATTNKAAVEQPVARAPSASAEPLKVTAEPVSAPPAVALRRQTARPAAQPAQSSETSSATVQTTPSAAETPAAMSPAQAPATNSLESNSAAPAADLAQPRNIAEASAFLGLPGSHYTLVLASVRNASALNALIIALEALPGQLYLLKLGMPDGAWYSLCWSEFDDLDAARAARASLPADAAITSGWPRKIGLLQNEIAR